jgi:hypothetical protein
MTQAYRCDETTHDAHDDFRFFLDALVCRNSRRITRAPSVAGDVPARRKAARLFDAR